MSLVFRPNRSNLIRARALAAAMLASSLLLASCGSDTSDTARADSTASDGAPNVSDGAGSGPIVVEHAFGTLELDAAPQRIVTLGWLDADIATALGVEPVMIGEFPFTDSGISPWLEGELTSTPELIATASSGNGAATIDYERIAALAPDLIVATSLQTIEMEYENLSAIAPVLAPQETKIQHIAWQDQTRHLAKALDRQDTAAELIGTVESVVDDAVEQYRQLDGLTYSLSLGVPQMVRVVQDTEDAAMKLLGSFGLIYSERAAALESLNDGSGGAAVSAENLDAIDADLVIIAYFGSNGAQEQWESSPLFPTLTAVQNGRYLPIDSAAIAALRNPSPLAVPWAIDNVIIEGAVAIVEQTS